MEASHTAPLPISVSDLKVRLRLGGRVPTEPKLLETDYVYIVGRNFLFSKAVSVDILLSNIYFL